MHFTIIYLPLLLLAVSLATHAQRCPRLYKRFSAEHTFCLPPNRDCSIVKRGVTENDKELIVKLHNDYRSKVATGQERNGGGLPTAANMLEMVWDEELSAVAQKLAETCIFKHDCGSCRRVRAFSVGQNIGLSYNLRKPPAAADWQNFIKGLYNEVSVFNKKYIQPYIPGPYSQEEQYGHFTQMVWATSWKIGCGWAVFKEGNTFTSYTVCNYGPAGNMVKGEMYKAGPPCSACPKNSCCGNSCKKRHVAAKYPGLCKVLNQNKPPEGFGPHGKKYIFFCDFSNEHDCAMSFLGKHWRVVRTEGGNWLSIVLKGGERTKIIFKKKFETKGDICTKVIIRKGPNVDGQAESGEGASILDAGFWKPEFKLNFQGFPKELRQEFMPMMYGINPKEAEVQYSFVYSVPRGAPPQFVEIKQVSVQDGKCVI